MIIVREICARKARKGHILNEVFVALESVQKGS